MTSDGVYAQDGLGIRIKEARLSAGLDRITLADKVGVTSNTVALWELEKGTPNIMHLAQIARVTGLSLAWLRKGL